MCLRDDGGSAQTFTCRLFVSKLLILLRDSNSLQRYFFKFRKLYTFYSFSVMLASAHQVMQCIKLTN